MSKYETLQNVVDIYKNDKDVHRDIYFEFKNNVNEAVWLKSHRDYIVKNRHGYGNRAFHWMWKLLVDSMPNPFSFLEIGVFKGQTINLVSYLAQQQQKTGKVYGITPLDTTDGHPDVNYSHAIVQLYETFDVSMDNLQIVEGLSNDPDIQNFIRDVVAPTVKKFDMIYIDGGHSYEVAKSDMEFYIPLLTDGGYLIIDDCSTHLDMPPDICLSYTEPKFQCIGIPEVTRAVEEVVETNPKLKHQFAVGHNRVWKLKS